ALAVVRAVAGCAWGWLEERLVEDDFTVEHQRTLLANRLTGGIRHVDTASVEDVGEWIGLLTVPGEGGHGGLELGVAGPPAHRGVARRPHLGHKALHIRRTCAWQVGFVGLDGGLQVDTALYC